MNSFFLPQKKKKDESNSPSQISDLESPKSSSATVGQQALDSCIIISNVVKAEIIWTLKIVDHGFSLRSRDDQSDLFSTMFLGSAVARGFQMGRTKTMYEITHGLAPCFKSILNDAIGRSDVYTYLFDESLNEVTQSSEMDRHVRLWNADSSQVQFRYFSSSFLGHTGHLDLLNHLET